MEVKETQLGIIVDKIWTPFSGVVSENESYLVRGYLLNACVHEDKLTFLLREPVTSHNLYAIAKSTDTTILDIPIGSLVDVTGINIALHLYANSIIVVSKPPISSKKLKSATKKINDALHVLLAEFMSSIYDGKHILCNSNYEKEIMVATGKTDLIYSWMEDDHYEICKSIKQHYYELIDFANELFEYIVTQINERYRDDIAILKRHYEVRPLHVLWGAPLRITYNECGILSDKFAHGKTLEQVIRERYGTDVYVVDEITECAFTIVVNGIEIIKGQQNIHEPTILEKIQKNDRDIVQKYISALIEKNIGPMPYGGFTIYMTNLFNALFTPGPEK